MSTHALKWRQIAETIEAEITSGIFKNGDKLPTVVVLAERFDVNRHTVRKALDFLQQSGVVSMQQGRGTYVTKSQADNTLFNRLAFRLGYTAQFGRNAALDRSLMRECLEISQVSADDDLASMFQIGRGDLVWKIVTRASIDREPVCLSEHYLPLMRFPSLPDLLERENYNFTNIFLRLGISAYGRKETVVQASVPSPQQQANLRLKPNQPVLVTMGQDENSKTRDIIQYTVTTWASHRVYLLDQPHPPVSQPYGAATNGYDESAA